MKKKLNFFGFFKGMQYSKEDCEDFEVYKQYKNKLSKQEILAYFDTLNAAYACFYSKEIFTGQALCDIGYPAGIYHDGEYRFPTDFAYYLKTYDIGIPYDYEEYITAKMNKRS